MNKYFKNFILCGDIDHHCLLCRETFQLITDIEKHIRWEKHRKNIKDQEYLPKFKKECVYKFGNNYYCETCNFVAPNMLSLNEHIRGDKHKGAKTNPTSIIKKLVGQYDSGYVVIGKIIINKQQWHCIVGGKCLLCAVDVKNEHEHIALQEHMIKLIQCDTKCKNDRYYRVINGEIYQCYTCKQTFTSETFTKHIEGPKCDNNDEIEIKKLQEACNSKDVDTITEDITRMADLEKKLVQTLQEFFTVDEKKNTAACKHCDTSVNIDFKAMIEHMKNEHDSTVETKRISDSSESSEEVIIYREVQDSGKRRSELSKYGKEHSIRMNFNGSKGFCTLCTRYLSAHKKNFKEHIWGTLHRGHLELKSLKKPKTHEMCLIETKDVYSLPTIINYSPDMGGFWVNTEFRIDVNSFLLLYFIERDPHYMKTMCYVCDELFPQGQERNHCVTMTHRTKFNAAKLLKIEGEFMREIRPNLYHCGFCNQTLPYWETVEKHVQSWRHTFDKHGKNILTTKSYEYWRNFGSSSICIKSMNSDDFYMQLMHNVFGYSEVGAR